MRQFALLLWSISSVAQSPSRAARADNLSDLRDWRSGMPACAAWNCEGFSTAWHAEQVRAGRRLIPSVFVPNYDAYEASAKNVRLFNRQIAPHAASLRWLAEHDVPLCLRTNNVCDGFTKSKRYRGGNFDAQPLVYRQLAEAGASTFDQRPVCDPFADAAHWATEGRLWGASPWVGRIADFIPRVPWLLFVENNEGNYDGIGYGDGKGYLQKDRTWRSDLEALSVRLAKWQVAERGSPTDAQTIFWVSRRDQYRALFREFRGAGPEGWKSAPFYTAGYGGSMNLLSPVVPRDLDVIGYDGEGLAYDALSGGQYINGQNGDLTSLHYWSQVSNLIPHWEWTEKRNRQAYREVSVSINAMGAVAGNNAGIHEVVTPAIFDAWCQWLLWSLREVNVPMLLRYWNGSATKPADAFSTDPRLAPSAGSGQAGLTHADYVLAMCRAVDRICEHPTLREFWLNGRPVIVPPATGSGPAHPTDVFREKFAPGTKYPREGDADNRWRVLECDANDSRSAWKWGAEGKNIIGGHNRVWACATKIAGKASGESPQAPQAGLTGPDWLVYIWSPCKLNGPVKLTIPEAGDVLVDAPQPWSYWLVNHTGVTARKLETP